MKLYNICVRKAYQKNGEEKVSWPQVGNLVHFPAGDGKKEGYKIEIPILGSTQLFVFEATDRRERPAREEAPVRAVESGEEIRPEDVPF